MAELERLKLGDMGQIPSNYPSNFGLLFAVHFLVCSLIQYPPATIPVTRIKKHAGAADINANRVAMRKPFSGPKAIEHTSETGGVERARNDVARNEKSR